MCRFKCNCCHSLVEKAKDNCSDLSSVSPIEPSPVKVPSKTMQSSKCDTNDDDDYTLVPDDDKCPVVSGQISSTTNLDPCIAATPLAVLSLQIFKTNQGMPPP